MLLTQRTVGKRFGTWYPGSKAKIIMEDFNVPLYDYEKMGGNASQLEDRMDLMEFINKQGLMDMDLHGIQFTQSNKRVGKDCIQARLDQALISPNQTKDFMCKMEASQKVGSDHFPLILSAIKINLNKNFPFRFEKMWLQHPQFESKLVEWWSIDIDGMTLYRIASKLKNVKREAKTQNKNSFGNIFENKSVIKEEILKTQDKIQKVGYSPDLLIEENEKLAKYHDIITKEEIYWRQRSRQLWLSEGDKNTNFFPSFHP